MSLARLFGIFKSSPDQHTPVDASASLQAQQDAAVPASEANKCDDEDDDEHREVRGQAARDLAAREFEVAMQPALHGSFDDSLRLFATALQASGGYDLAIIHYLIEGDKCTEFVGNNGVSAWASPNPKTGGRVLSIGNPSAPPDGARNIVLQIDDDGRRGPERYYNLHGDEVFAGDEALKWSFPRGPVKPQ